MLQKRVIWNWNAVTYLDKNLLSKVYYKVSIQTSSLLQLVKLDRTRMFDVAVNIAS